MKKYARFKEEEDKRHRALLQGTTCVKFLQLAFAPVAGYFLTCWALVPFGSIFLVLHLFKITDLEKEGWRQFIKVWVYFVFCAIQILFLLCYLFINFWAMFCINLIQVLGVLFVKKRYDELKAFILKHNPKKDPYDGTLSESAKKFFNKDLIKNLSQIQSKCEKKQRE